MSKTTTRQPRNRDVGIGGHPTRFAPKEKDAPTVATLDLSADDILGETDDTALDTLTAYRDSVLSGDVVPSGLKDLTDGQSFTNALDRQIEYARRGKKEAADALRFHGLRLGASEDFTVDGRTFSLQLGDDGSASIVFETEVDAMTVPDVDGMTARDRHAYISGATEAIEDAGVKVVGSEGSSATLRTATRPPHFNSLPDCANKVVDVELDAFVAADNFRSRWRKRHVKPTDDWLSGTGFEFVG